MWWVKRFCTLEYKPIWRILKFFSHYSHSRWDESGLSDGTKLSSQSKALLRSCQLFNWSRTSLSFKKRKVHYSLHKSPLRIIFWGRSVQSTSSWPLSLTCILKLIAHLHLCLPSGLFPSHSPTTMFYFSCMLHAPPISLIWALVVSGEVCKLCCWSLWNFLQLPNTSS